MLFNSFSNSFSLTATSYKPLSVKECLEHSEFSFSPIDKDKIRRSVEILEERYCHPYLSYRNIFIVLDNKMYRYEGVKY